MLPRQSVCAFISQYLVDFSADHGMPVDKKSGASVMWGGSPRRRAGGARSESAVIFALTPCFRLLKAGVAFVIPGLLASTVPSCQLMSLVVTPKISAYHAINSSQADIISGI